ncbi:unnamed protein product, partial [Discosporangium mesarthrocarpum]
AAASTGRVVDDMLVVGQQLDPWQRKMLMEERNDTLAGQEVIGVRPQNPGEAAAATTTSSTESTAPAPTAASATGSDAPTIDNNNSNPAAAATAAAAAAAAAATLHNPYGALAYPGYNWSQMYHHMHGLHGGGGAGAG